MRYVSLDGSVVVFNVNNICDCSRPPDTVFYFHQLKEWSYFFRMPSEVADLEFFNLPAVYFCDFQFEKSECSCLCLKNAMVLQYIINAFEIGVFVVLFSLLFIFFFVHIKTPYSSFSILYQTSYHLWVATFCLPPTLPFFWYACVRASSIYVEKRKPTRCPLKLYCS
jgi:hypothetical protein